MEFKHTPILMSSIDSFSKFLSEFTGTEIPVENISGSEALRNLFKVDSKIKFPIIIVHFNSIVPDYESYNYNALRRFGSILSVDRNNETSYKYNLSPVIVTLDIKYITQDKSNLISFIEKWYANIDDMNFDLVSDALGNNANYSISIRVIPSLDLNFPEFEQEEVGPKFTLETSVQLRTYTGYVEEVPLIKEIDLNIVQGIVHHDDKFSNEPLEKWVIKPSNYKRRVNLL